MMAIVVVLPIPFGNLPPALALKLIGLGPVFRDVVAVAIGIVGAGLTLCMSAGLMMMAWVLGSEWILGWV